MLSLLVPAHTPVAQPRQPFVIRDELSRLQHRLAFARRLNSPQARRGVPRTVDAAREALLDAQRSAGSRLAAARKAAQFGGDVVPLNTFSIDPDMKEVAFRWMTGVYALELVRARAIVRHEHGEKEADALFTYETPFGHQSYSSKAMLFHAVEENTATAENKWQTYKPEIIIKDVGAYETVQIGNSFVALHDAIPMSAVAHESGLSAKEALQQQRQEAIDFVTQATSLGNAKSVTAEDLAKRNVRNKDFATVLCDDDRYAADARWRRMRRWLYDQLAQRRVDLTKAVCGPTATTAFFVGDASFTSNRRMRQIVKWEELRTTFARFGYSFSVPEFNTSALVSCCLAPVEHPVRETTKFESQRKFRARVDMAKSEKGKRELQLFGKLSTRGRYEAYSCSQCTRCRRTHARDTSSAELINFLGIVTMATGRRPVALSPQRAAS